MYANCNGNHGSGNGVPKLHKLLGINENAPLVRNIRVAESITMEYVELALEGAGYTREEIVINPGVMIAAIYESNKSLDEQLGVGLGHRDIMKEATDAVIALGERYNSKDGIMSEYDLRKVHNDIRDNLGLGSKKIDLGPGAWPSSRMRRVRDARVKR